LSVSNVAHATLTYQAASNVVSSVTVNKP